MRECSPPDDNESGAACSELQCCRARQQCAVSTHTAVSTLSTLQHLQYLVYLSSIYTVALTGSILSVLYQHYLQLSIYTVHSIYTAVSTVSTLQLGLQQSTTLQRQHSGDQGGPEQGAGRTCRYIIQIAASIYQPRILV